MIGARKIFLTLIFCLLATMAAEAQRSGSGFGPNVQAYLDYLKTEMTVTDARESQREVNPAYIRHNRNRVNALYQFAVNLARKTQVDYIPEMEAVTVREFRLLFPENAPKAADLKEDEIYNFSYRYLGSIRNAETFYIFARLDPYEEEQARGTSQTLPPTAQTSPENVDSERESVQNDADGTAAHKATTDDAVKTTPVKNDGVPPLTRERLLFKTNEKQLNPNQQPNP